MTKKWPTSESISGRPPSSRRKSPSLPRRAVCRRQRALPAAARRGEKNIAVGMAARTRGRRRVAPVHGRLCACVRSRLQGVRAGALIGAHALCLSAPPRAPADRYQKRKYVWKMLYIYVLGYEVDFGHMEALNLITAQGYAEKTVGYLACVLLLSETNEFLRLVINSVKNDLASHNDEIQSLVRKGSRLVTH